MRNEIWCPSCNGGMFRDSRIEDGEKVYSAECVTPSCGFGVNSHEPITQEDLERMWKDARN